MEVPVERAEDGGGGVGKEDAVEAGNRVVGRDEPGALGDGDQGAEVVEEVHEEEDEDDLQQALVERAADIELEGGGGERVEAAGGGRPVRQAQCPGEGGGGEHADENGAADLLHFQRHHQDQAEERQRGGGIADVAHADEGLRVAHHQARVAEADEGDEEADAAGHRGVKLVGNGAQNHLPDARRGEREKEDAGEKDRSQGRLPGDVHLDADGVGEVGVEAHAGGQRDGIARHVCPSGWSRRPPTGRWPR